MKETYHITIKAEDRPGLLHLITGILNRRLIKIESLAAGPADDKGVVLITIMVTESSEILSIVLLKLKNIIEVYTCTASQD